MGFAESFDGVGALASLDLADATLALDHLEGVAVALPAFVVEAAVALSDGEALTSPHSAVERCAKVPFG
jgi:hypothetical protein